MASCTKLSNIHLLAELTNSIPNLKISVRQAGLESHASRSDVQVKLRRSVYFIPPFYNLSTAAVPASRAQHVPPTLT